MNTSERVAIVTGGGQGIGRCVSRRFVEAGVNVAIAEIDDEAGREAAEELSETGRAIFLPADVGDEASVRTLIDVVTRRFGRIDVLVNNAGIMINAPVERLALDQWSRVLATNLTGMFLCAKHAAPLLRRQHGSIVNIASTRALMSEANTEAYSASKGGVLGLTHALAVSLGPDVRVNAISPGWIETGDWKKRATRVTPALSATDHAQHPAGRVGVPDDVAALVLFLAGAESGFITGQNFVVDGGMTRKMIYV